MRQVIALLTDFGLRDAYVGMVRGVLAGLAPEAHVVDLTHEVPPGDVRRAAYFLWQAHPAFPDGTIFLVVVDPGVGTARRPIAVRLPRGFGVGPDNGIFSYAVDQASAPEAVVLDPSRLVTGPISATFHGRDLFAPAAARLATGSSLADLGSGTRDLIRLPAPRLELDAHQARGEVIHVDAFGNVITSIGRLLRRAEDLELRPCWAAAAGVTLDPGSVRVEVSGRAQLPLSRTFGDVPQGRPLAYIGSSDLLELAIRGERADVALGLRPGDPVTLHFKG